MGKLDMECGGFHVTLEDQIALAPRSDASGAESAPGSARTVALGGEGQVGQVGHGEQYAASSVVRVVASKDGAEAWTLTLTSSGAETTIGETAAVCLGGSVALAIGPYVVAIEAATGAIAWQRQCDPASCFGIYRAPSGKGLIAHGEQQIARLAEEDGAVVWSYAGKDIFTGPFAVTPEGIIATDFGGDVYALSFDGALQAVEKGKPFPH